MYDQRRTAVEQDANETRSGGPVDDKPFQLDRIARARAEGALVARRSSSRLFRSTRPLRVGNGAITAETLRRFLTGLPALQGSASDYLVLNTATFRKVALVLLPRRPCSLANSAQYLQS